MNNKIYENIYNELSKPDSILKHYDTIKAHFTQKYQEYIPLVKTYRDIGDPSNIELMEPRKEALDEDLRLIGMLSQIKKTQGNLEQIYHKGNDIISV